MAFTSHQQPATVSANEELRCSSCRVNVSPNERNSHYRSDWHRYNVKRKCVKMEPIEKSLFEAKLRGIIASGHKIDSISNKKKKKALNKKISKNYNTLISNDQWNEFDEYSSNQSNKAPQSLLNYSCTLCSKSFKTHQQCLSHLNTKKHKIEFIKYHKNLRNQQQEEINAFHATNDPQLNPYNPTIDNLIPLNKLQPIKTIKNNPFITIKQKRNYNKNKNNNNNTIDDESKVNNIEGKTETEIDSVVMNNDRLCIDTTHCLFCTQSFDTMDLSIEHMISEHGFFIPLPKRLTELNGILKTAGAIIGKYFQCVWCWKIFKSLRGAQTHMRHMAHCKLQIEYSSNITYNENENENENEKVTFSVNAIVNENEDSPFLQYFDFDKVIIDSDNENENKNRELMIREKRYITEINDFDELVRNDGTVIGHRENMMVYKQKQRHVSKYHETQTEGQIIAQMNNPQKKYKLQEMEKEKNINAFEKSGAKTQTKNDKIKDNESMELQQRAHKVSYQNWVNLQKSKQLY